MSGTVRGKLGTFDSGNLNNLNMQKNACVENVTLKYLDCEKTWNDQDAWRYKFSLSRAWFEIGVSFSCCFHVVHVLEPAPMELTSPGCMKYRHVWHVPRIPAVEIKV